MAYKILIDATSSFIGGSYTLLNCLIRELNSTDYLKINKINVDILVSRSELLESRSENVNIIYKEYIKKYNVFKLISRNRELKSIVKKCEYDVFFALQNIGIGKIKAKQVVLIQNILPFVDFAIDRNYIKYRIVLPLIYKFTLKNYNMIFVQTEWLKNIIIKKYKYRGKIKVLRPIDKKINDYNFQVDSRLIDDLNDSMELQNHIKIFYPGSTEKYKNSNFLIETVNKFNDLSPDKKYILYITLDGESTQNIKYIGRVKYEMMNCIYNKVDALIFPSLCESLGLPLIEAQIFNIDIIAADRPYSREICKENCMYFNPVDEESLIQVLKKYTPLNKYKRENGICNNLIIDEYIQYIKEIVKVIDEN